MAQFLLFLVPVALRGVGLPSLGVGRKHARESAAQVDATTRGTAGVQIQEPTSRQVTPGCGNFVPLCRCRGRGSRAQQQKSGPWRRKCLSVLVRVALALPLMENAFARRRGAAAVPPPRRHVPEMLVILTR